MNIIELAKEAGFIINGGRIESPYIGGSDIGHRLKEFANLVRAEREWVDLTDDEIDEIESKILIAGGEHNDIYRAVIAADREKNK